MDKNINNIIFSINNLMLKFIDSQNHSDTTFEKLANFISSVNENDNETHIYFLINNELNNENSQETSDKTIPISFCFKENIKDFLRKYKIKIKENNIKFIVKKLPENLETDVDTCLSDIASISESNEILIDNTIIMFSDYQIGEVAFLDGYFSIFINSSLLSDDDLSEKEIQKISNKIIDIDEDDLTIDSISYDFISFLDTLDEN